MYIDINGLDFDFDSYKNKINDNKNLKETPTSSQHFIDDKK